MFLGDSCRLSGFLGILEDFWDSRGFLRILGFLENFLEFSGFKWILDNLRVSWGLLRILSFFGDY